MVEGVGIGLRKELFGALSTTKRRVDWLEIVSENYLGATGRAAVMLERFSARWPIIPHGVSLSVGSEIPEGYLDGLGALVHDLSPPYVSDHLCYSSIGARNYLDLLPLPRHAEAVERVAHNARRTMEAVGVPLVLENITTYAEMPGSTMTESEFLGAVAEQAGLGLLLDVNNLYVNAVNQRREPLELLDAFPLQHVRQLHLAGHTWDGELLLDTHAAPVAPAVWELYIEVLKRCGPVPTLIEWDQHIPSLDAVLDEADRARDLMERHA
jgi:uncharacterized protein (UPF0276 family)